MFDTLDWTKVALLVVDLQNDFLHPDGAYRRNGVESAEALALPGRLAPLARAAQAKGAWVAATQFTLVPGKAGAPFISAHLAQLRPFLGPGDFAPGSWGQDLVSELKPVDLQVEKVVYSAFHMTRLEWTLRRAGIETLIFAGVVTNGGVAATLYDAHIREFNCMLLRDGCAAFSAEAHAASVAALSTVATVIDCAGLAALLTA